MKSGLLVLVDLFSLVSMTLFSVFIISQDIRLPAKSFQSFRAYEIAIAPVAPEALALYFNHRPSIFELIDLRPRLARQNGEDLIGDGFSAGIFITKTPDSLRVVVRPDIVFTLFSVDIARINHPIALTTDYRVTIQEQSPNPKRARSWSNVKLGQWDDISISRD
jgi:hypothetical protein